MSAQQRTLDDQIAEIEQKTLDQLLFEIDVGYACRALMGFGKGKDVMGTIHALNPERYAQLMARAHEILDEEFKHDVNPPEL